MSLSIELDDRDLLDIDGSDDATMMFAKRAKRAQKRVADKQPSPQVVNVRRADPEDLRATNPIERQAEIYPDAPTLGPDGMPTLIFNEPSVIVSSSQSVTAMQLPTVRKTQMPSHFTRPRERKVSESYPPVAVMTEKQAALKLGGGNSSRWTWVAAAVIGTLLVIAGSLRAAPHTAPADTSAAQPPPAAVEEAPKPAADDGKVVKFDDGDAVAIKRKPPVAVAPAAHHWTPPPAKKAVVAAAPAAKADKTDDKKADDAPAAKKKTAQEKELEDLQLKAMER